MTPLSVAVSVRVRPGSFDRVLDTVRVAETDLSAVSDIDADLSGVVDFE